MAAFRKGLAAALLLAACARPRIPPVVPPVTPISRAPDIGVGVVVGEGSLTIGGDEALALATPDGGWVGEVPPAETARVDANGEGLRVRLPPSAAVLAPGGVILVVGARSETRVRLNGRDYRGRFTLSATGGQVSAVNVVDLEDYLLGVVGAELGRRDEADLAALRAQAVVSRTLALNRIGSGRDYDLLATVADQAYAGVNFEHELATRAVQETRGQVLTWQGEVIDAFFHSTCAGRTAPGTEVFPAADRPYLRSIPDLDPTGRPWCAISPRYRWRETWTGEALVRTLRETLPAAGGPEELAATLRDIRVLARTGTGRVASMEIHGANGALRVSGPVARQVLRTADGGILRSADFTLQITRSGERIVQLTAEGAGAGHGVGMCQWGAIGRSRAGFSYQSILSAYFPGTGLTRTY